MKNNFCRCSAIVLALLLGFAAGAQAEQHRATRLGNPATRFAPTMRTPDDLRARFRDPALRPDFAEVLHQWGWEGNLDDFFAAGLTNEIVEWQIPVGNVMPFMASREDGRPVCLRNVHWAGKEPISAYAFTFTSNGRLYRCIIPKPCSNFFVTDLGPAPRSGLAIDCDVPGKIVAGHKLEVCLNVHNTGNIPEPEAVVSLPVPENSTVVATTDGGIVTNNTVQWEIPNLPANAVKGVCAQFKSRQPGTLVFNSSVSSASVPPVQSSCETEVDGIPALLLEKSDNPDPVSINTTTTYTVKVTNQGTANDSNIHIIVTVDNELTPVSSPAGSIHGQVVDFPVVPTLAPKDAVTYTVIAKGVKAGIAITKFSLSSDILTSPITAEESTTVY